MKILIIGYVWPEPNSSAAGSRMMQLIKTFRAQDWDVEFASPAQTGEHMEDLKLYGVTSQAIELNHDSFNDYIASLNPDIVVFDRFMMEEQFGWRVEKYAPNALRVLNTEDLHSLRDARHTAIKQNRAFELSDMHSDLGVREIAAIYRSDLTLMISEFETALLKDSFQVPDTHVMHLPFMLDTQSLRAKSFAERQDFVFIGNFRHAPNWDAVLQLKQVYWPKIRAQLPQAKLNIYGAYPPPKATQLHNEKEGFLVKGWADNALEVIEDARIMLSPIRFGAGIKGKLVEAMQVGTPSITTTVGAEAMAGKLPWNGIVTDDVEEFVAAAVSLYQDTKSYALMQHNGHQIITQRYEQSTWQDSLIGRLKIQLQLKDRLRNNFFLGRLARHHSMKSTQYMSQWIALKNAQPSDS
ncbi:glycosyltransferase family 4 protein [Marinomonas ostreistagni]|uniref:glycosyltransferase family 4 protein n=1 Tax=Marinomonas ostreistagni TaxID=359209 RepID=UPI0019514E43|nr:glycosyltransferase family 4 protein [Marinomonas ostreistagni]MBM6550487.1 glycosyltransferase family 4 protein [Marinomonas ostreistagni]